ncbi:aminoglycoside phosphotransferase family protein [Kibdelosporangium philippinense]|uniref:Aminoglycoside phosphotransferase family protein n=1 Tax=Kibdelosporangium philippinense TaxID=211113 RepID=A0ABS8ZKT1_9PSEU|nr:aminoglycoside phosphotransferase family protein [Kibdelosporangium philippinense]MCE7008177.1 aminoglycoside phosphotransferase family protein [Kibdelosporangium philippinense]
MTAETAPAIDAALARRLVDTQFPQWANLPLLQHTQAGSDHVIYRLGDELSVRLPRHSDAIKQAKKEAEWLPQLAPHLPLAIPTLVEVGEADFGYPWPWAVSRWLDGEVATVDALSNSHEAAAALAEFLTALHRFDGKPTEDLTGQPLAARDTETRSAITKVGDAFDTAAMTELWDAVLAAPEWDRAPVWFHGDFHTGNLLTTNGRLSAVIDFGELGVGDPACDLIIAFTLMSAETRATFRTALDVDDATWTRGRGWALATGLNAYTYYAAVNPRVAAQTTRQITQALTG